MSYKLIIVFLCCIFLTEIFAQNEPSETVKPNLVIGDFGRSLIGTYLGAIAGAGIGGILPLIYINRDQKGDSYIWLPYFPGTFLGASIGSALGSSLFFYLSKNREVGYWKLVKLTLLPSLISSIPVSIAAAINENDKNVQVAGVTTLASVGVTFIWAVVVYRHFPLRTRQALSFSFGQPQLKYLYPDKNQHTIFIKIAEIKF